VLLRLPVLPRERDGQTVLLTRLGWQLVACGRQAEMEVELLAALGPGIDKLDFG